MDANTTRRLAPSVKRKELVGKLNQTCTLAFRAAADIAKLRGNPYELVPFIQQLVLSDRSDVQMILAESGVDTSRIAADLTRALDKLPRGATWSQPDALWLCRVCLTLTCVSSRLPQ